MHLPERWPINTQLTKENRYELLDCCRSCHARKDRRCCFYLLDGTFVCRNYCSLSESDKQGLRMAVEAEKIAARLSHVWLFHMAMKMRVDMKHCGLFAPWLVISAIWIVMVGFWAWRNIPRDDWLTEPSNNQLRDAVNLLIYNPVARAVALDSVVLALVPPILVLAFSSALIWWVGFKRR
jgi:hypothetical protein